MKDKQGDKNTAADALQAILGEVVVKRAEQDEEWGGPDHDDQHRLVEWCDFIEIQSRKALEECRAVDVRERLINIAALAVAAVQSHDRLAKR